MDKCPFAPVGVLFLCFFCAGVCTSTRHQASIATAAPDDMGLRGVRYQAYARVTLVQQFQTTGASAVLQYAFTIKQKDIAMLVLTRRPGETRLSEKAGFRWLTCR